MIVWSTLVVESWKRKQNAIADQWLMRDFRDKTLERPQFRPIIDIDPETRSIKRIANSNSYLRFIFLGLPVTLLFMAVTIYCVVHTRIAYESYFKNKEQIPYLASFIPSMANTIYITIFYELFKPVAGLMTDYENYQLWNDHENSLLTKVILFQFVNAYIANIIFAFWFRDFTLLSKNVASIVAFSQIFNNCYDYLYDIFYIGSKIRKVQQYFDHTFIEEINDQKSEL